MYLNTWLQRIDKRQQSRAAGSKQYLCGVGTFALSFRVSWHVMSEAGVISGISLLEVKSHTPLPRFARRTRQKQHGRIDRHLVRKEQRLLTREGWLPHAAFEFHSVLTGGDKRMPEARACTESGAVGGRPRVQASRRQQRAHSGEASGGCSTRAFSFLAGGGLGGLLSFTLERKNGKRVDVPLVFLVGRQGSRKGGKGMHHSAVCVVRGRGLRGRDEKKKERKARRQKNE